MIFMKTLDIHENIRSVKTKLFSTKLFNLHVFHPKIEQIEANNLHPKRKASSTEANNLHPKKASLTICGYQFASKEG